MQRDFRSFGETLDARTLVIRLLTSYFSTSYTSYRIDDEDLESLAHGPEALAGGLSHHHGPYGLRSHRYLHWFDDLRLDVLQSQVTHGPDDPDVLHMFPILQENFQDDFEGWFWRRNLERYL